MSLLVSKHIQHDMYWDWINADTKKMAVYKKFCFCLKCASHLCADVPAPRKNRSPYLPEYIHTSLRVAGWMAYFLLCSKWMSSLRRRKRRREPVRESKQRSQHKQEGINWFILAGFVRNKQSISMHWAPSKGRKTDKNRRIQGRKLHWRVQTPCRHDWVRQFMLLRDWQCHLIYKQKQVF